MNDEATKNKPKRRPPTAKRKREAGEQASHIVQIVEATAIAIAGPEAEIRPIEHMLIDEPLAAVLARIDQSQIERANSIMAPVLLACGLALYGARVYGLIASQADAKKSSGEVELKPVNYAATPGTLRREGSTE